MSKTTATKDLDLADFFSASEARNDRWRSLHRVTGALAAGEPAEKLRAEAVALLAEIGPLEEFQGYPGPRVMALLHAREQAGDWPGLARLVQRVSAALLADSYHDDAKAWHDDNEGEVYVPDTLPPALTHSSNRRPYFEILMVSPADRSAWPELRNKLRALRRETDEFIYEPVIVGNFEDAVLATILNYNLQAVVISEGFPFTAPSSLPALRDFLSRHGKLDRAEMADQDSGLALARAIRRIRPELDIYLVTDRAAEEVAGSDDATAVRRIFYAVEEMLEIHLSLLGGVGERYRTPFFDNLKHYAQRPIGTFHALPVARGKSIFKSNWIRDVGDFYGMNLFLAESSATTGGLDSLLEPTGNLKLAQEAAARAFGADHCYFGTNGTSTSNKIIHSALVRPGDIVLIDRDCHKSHHYGLVLAGGQPYYIDAFPLPQYSMYGSLAIRPIKAALLKLKAEGKLDQVRMLVLTNCTFDGHIANAKRTMEECLAIKPDLIFLWDEAWFAFARFSPYLRGRTGMGAAADLRAQLADPAYRDRYQKFKAAAGRLDLKNKKLIDLHLLPDPELARIRVYQSTSVHKSMSCLRQGSVILVADQDFPTVEEAFHEAFFTHTSTSPNQQILATLDTARRQMELEGYQLVNRAIQLAIGLRREINSHPLISKYFRALTPAEMIPAEFRQSGYADFTPGSWGHAMEALQQDEFFLDPTRVTVLCGRAGYDGTEFKGLLAEEHDIQINKTSRNSVLVQLNINNTRSDMAHIIKALADMARAIDRRLADGGAEARARFDARVKSLMEDVPDLPDFSKFHDAFRTSAKSATPEGHIREAYYMAYDAANCEHVKLASKEIEQRLAKGPELVSANFVIPYPPGFPIMVPGQVITAGIITFMRKLDVKEIHGYEAALGLKLLKPAALKQLRKK